MNEEVYDVFARKDRGDRLCHIGYVDALDDETARHVQLAGFDSAAQVLEERLRACGLG